jgi:hypothetical protein
MIQIHPKGVTDFSSYNSDNKLRQEKPKRTRLQFLVSLFPLLFGELKPGWLIHKPEPKRTGP